MLSVPGDCPPVVVASGRGDELHPLNLNLPKCLIPLVNLPMIWYPLRLLDRSGYTAIRIICLEKESERIKSAIQEVELTIPWFNKHFSYQFCTIKKEEEEVSALIKIHKECQKDLMVIGCDLITDQPLNRFCDIHRLHGASLTSLLHPTQTPEGPQPGLKSKRINKDISMIAFDSADGRLLMSCSEADFEDYLPISRTLLIKHPNMNLTTQLDECHLYILSADVLDSTDANQYNSIQSELVPSIIFDQYKTGHDNDSQEDLYHDSDQLSLELALSLSSWTDHTHDMDSPYHNTKTRCYSVISQQGLCMRVNSVSSYYEISKQIGRVSEFFGLSHLFKPPAGIRRSQAGADSVIGTGLILGDKSSIKKSMIGKNCKISDKVKISNSIIMDNVTIAEGCSIQTCIVCDSAVIQEKCDLTETIIGRQQTVESSRKMNNEVLAEDEDDDM